MPALNAKERQFKMANTIIDRLHTEFSELIGFLSAKKEIALHTVAAEHLPKSLLLACASHFERSLTESIVEFTAEVTSDQHVIKWLVETRVVKRQYHTWFDWNTDNANQFFAMFGNDFKTYMKTLIRDDRDLDESIKAFLEIGRDRNRIVHSGFGNSDLGKTSEEIYNLYGSAKLFVNSFPRFLKEYSEHNFT